MLKTGQRAQSEPTTLQQVAARAGVSPGTASRFLNGKNKENRPAIAKRGDRVRLVAVQLGYRPNAAARSISRGRFRAVAFVTCGDIGTDWYPISELNGIHAALDKLEWRLLFNELPAAKINDSKLIPQLFRESAVDALLVNLLPDFAEKTIDYFEAQPVPCVWLNLKRDLRSVYPDDASGAAMGVRWLTKRGHKNIGYFSRLFIRTTHYSAADRFAGFTRTIKAEDLSPHRHLELYTDNLSVMPPVLQRAEQFLKTFPDTQAVLCYEYEEAICMRIAAQRLGRRVPEDLDIIGFSEREIHGRSGLNIAKLIVPFQEVGRRGVEMVEKIIDTGRLDVESISVPYKSILI
jgi:DNA-binding LacI/PurR family transcriptional regulator